MTMKLLWPMMALCLSAPLLLGAADAQEKKVPTEEKSGPTEAEMLKARKTKKLFYTKISEAITAAEKCGQPLVVALLPQQNQMVAYLRQKVIMRKEFIRDFAAQNFVVALVNVKPAKEPKQIETRAFKEPEISFLERFAVSPKAISDAKAYHLPEPKYTDLKCYPSVVVTDSDCTRELYRFPKWDAEAGFGVWLSQVVDSLKTVGIEPKISPAVQKILDNPDEPKKWK